MPTLFDPLPLRGIALPNRIAVSPMCQYSSQDGFATDWHLVHLGSRAVGGAGLVFTEAAAVLPEGRISPQDLGIWQAGHIEPLARATRFIREQGAVPGIQLAHAGRKASTFRPWSPRHGMVPKEEGGWDTVAPSALAYDRGYPEPSALDDAGILGVVEAFGAAADRALEAGFRIVEIHAAHGYLIQEFLSPLSNRRTDRWGGSFDNRTRLLMAVVERVRQAWPEEWPLFVRISAVEWVPDGWSLDESIELARRLGPAGVDLVDCSSGGNAAGARIQPGPGYQTEFAAAVRTTGILTGAVGMITAPAQADHIIRSGQADLVLLAREELRDPYWPLRAARELGVAVPWPPQYLRGAGRDTPARPSSEEANDRAHIAVKRPASTAGRPSGVRSDPR